jgi:hypothetical protein
MKRGGDEAEFNLFTGPTPRRRTLDALCEELRAAGWCYVRVVARKGTAHRDHEGLWGGLCPVVQWQTQPFRQWWRFWGPR